MKTLLSSLALLGCLAASGWAQPLAKTEDISEDIAPDGAVDLAFQMTFDAAPWRQWKAMIGDEPARLRAMLRHQFAAYNLENFKLDRNDLDRTAKLSVHSPGGPELRDDGTYQIPVESYFRLVNGAGRSWFFSGNNPEAANSLNNVKVTLPENAVNASVVNPGTADQALIFALTPPPSPVRWYYSVGATLAAVGLLTILGALLLKRPRFELMPAQPPRALPGTAAAAADQRATIAEPPPAAPVLNPFRPVSPAQPDDLPAAVPPPPQSKASTEPD